MNERPFPDPTPTAGYRFFRAAVHVAWSAYFRPIVTGTQHVPTSGPYVIAPSHRSNVDFAFAIYVTRRKTFFMAKDSLWHNKALGGFIGSMGAFPVHRGAADRGALTAAESVLRAGEPLVLFPEGTRKEGPVIGELLEGASFLAARTGAPIVPVGIAGTDLAMPRGAKVPRPKKVHLVIGSLVPAPVAEGGGRVPRRLIAETTEALRVELQAAYDEACGRLNAPGATSAARR
jgi:1-acyl-sn-glycerol-3-phosphate acyltransferase